jgi:transposase
MATGAEHGLQFSLNRPRLAQARRREGRYLLRSNLTGEAPSQLWEKYILLTQIEQAFKDLKGDLSLRPVYHSSDPRIGAHIFTCFLAYCLFASLKHLARHTEPAPLDCRSKVPTL